MIDIILYILLLPLVGTFLLLYLQNRSKKITGFVANLTIFVPFILSIYALYIYFSNNLSFSSVNLLTFAETENFSLNFGIYIDSLSLVMTSVVTSVSSLVHYYSISYMKNEQSYNRFFIYTNFFTFSMLLIVLSNNFFQLFIGWELVGLSSYLLIGYWIEKESAIKANYKAFLVNRVGDIGLILGLCFIFAFYNTTDYLEVFNLKYSLVSNEISLFGMKFSYLDLVCLLLFIGAMAKSAQIPLHFWLPDSMEGPTPISALIHAATMVTAGIYMVARLSPLYIMSESVSQFILYTGAITAFSLGLVALVQSDIKRIIAYSTISQLGYMTAALGASLYSLAIFHLMTHAFFKALLFLCAGSIIVKCHHEQDIRKISGLRKYMPVTYMAYIYASLSLIGFPFTSGFYSKETIIDLIGHLGYTIPYILLLLSIFITAVYSGKIFFTVFFGSSSLKNLKHDYNVPENDKEMIRPLIILTVPSIFIGFFLYDSLMLGKLFSDTMHGADIMTSFYYDIVGNSLAFFLHSFFTINFLILTLGIIFSYLYYYKKSFDFHTPEIVSNLLKKEYGFVPFATNILPNIQNILSTSLWKKIDISFIDDGIINRTSNIFNILSTKIRKLQTGYIYHYSITIISALIVFLLIIFYRF